MQTTPHRGKGEGGGGMEDSSQDGCGMPRPPVPVAAQAHMSLPTRATGMVLAWIGVGDVKPRLFTAFRRGLDRFMSVKSTSDTCGMDSSKKVLLSSC